MAADAKLSPSFYWLNIAQFLGALNDNILKLLIIFYLIGRHGPSHSGAVTAGVGLAFVLPFLLFSAPAGCLADRLAKSRLIVWVKILEVVVTALAVVAFATGLAASLYLLMFAMALHSAFFAPAKYGIIPELVPREGLSHANGIIEACTFLAIICGTALASFLTLSSGGRFWLAATLCLGIALCGLAAAGKIGRTEACAPQRPVAWLPVEILRTLRSIRGDRQLLLAVFGLAYFLFVGAFAQLNLIGYGIEHLHLNEAESGYLFLAAALGIAGGSLIAAKLSGATVEFGLVPLGAIALSLVQLLLLLAPPSLPICLALIVVFGLAAGLFSLPLQTFIQLRAEPAMRGEVLAASSFINWVGIFFAAVVTYLFSAPFALTAAQGFALIGGLTLGLTLLMLRLFPELLQRAGAMLTPGSRP